MKTAYNPAAKFALEVSEVDFRTTAKGRRLKSKAAAWNGDASTLGIYSSSRGGHVAELLAMRPGDPRYNAIPLAAASGFTASVAYIATRAQEMAKAFIARQLAAGRRAA